MCLAHVLSWPHYVCNGVCLRRLSIGVTKYLLRLSLEVAISTRVISTNLWASVLSIIFIIIIQN